MSLSCLCVKCEATTSRQLAQLKGQLHQFKGCQHFLERTYAQKVV